MNENPVNPINLIKLPPVKTHTRFSSYVNHANEKGIFEGILDLPSNSNHIFQN